MADEKLDPVTGQKTTGHEWNGIEELNTRIPRVVLFFLAATTLFAIVYWILLPAWPTGHSYTKGVLGFDQRAAVMREVGAAAAGRATWTDRIATESYDEIARDPELMTYVREAGHTLFAENCAACHGTNGAGGPGFPNLRSQAWMWGGEPETIAETIRIGVNSTSPDTRISQMLPFGSTGALNRDQVLAVGAYVRSLSGQKLDADDQARREVGQTVFAENCVSCHGATGGGLRQSGAPNLTDQVWLYGGDGQSVYTSIYSGRQGHMPHWSERLSATEIKLLTLYVGTLAERKP